MRFAEMLKMDKMAIGLLMLLCIVAGAAADANVDADGIPATTEYYKPYGEDTVRVNPGPPGPTGPAGPPGGCANGVVEWDYEYDYITFNGDGNYDWTYSSCLNGINDYQVDPSFTYKIGGECFVDCRNATDYAKVQLVDVWQVYGDEVQQAIDMGSEGPVYCGAYATEELVDYCWINSQAFCCEPLSATKRTAKRLPYTRRTKKDKDIMKWRKSKAVGSNKKNKKDGSKKKRSKHSKP